MNERVVLENRARDGMVPVVGADEIPVGWVLKVNVHGRELAIANCDGEIRVLQSSCPHAGGPLGDNRLQDGCTLECPWHNSVFDARTGDVLRGPARKSVKVYESVVENGIVYVDLL